MKCDKCNNEANIEIRVIGSADDRVLHLCQDCYFNYINNLNSGDGFEEKDFKFFQDILADLLGSILQNTEEKHHETTEDNGPKCSKCGTGFKWILDNGRFGCDHCYEEFRDKVEQILIQTQGFKNHEGKVPQKYDGIKKLGNTIRKKEEALKNYVMEENYEDAAKLRDEIKELKSKVDEMIGEING